MNFSGVAHSGRDRITSMLALGKVYPPSERSIILEAELCPAPPHVAEALGLMAADAVIRRPRVTSLDGVPYQLSTSWFNGAHADIAPLLLAPEPIPQGTAAYLAQQTGLAFFGRSQEQVWASTGREEVELIDLPVGTPVLCGCCWFIDDEGAVLEFGEYVTAPERRMTFSFPVAG